MSTVLQFDTFIHQLVTDSNKRSKGKNSELNKSQNSILMVREAHIILKCFSFLLLAIQYNVPLNSLISI